MSIGDEVKRLGGNQSQIDRAEEQEDIMRSLRAGVHVSFQEVRDAFDPADADDIIANIKDGVYDQ